jgi:MFS family permease
MTKRRDLRLLAGAVFLSATGDFVALITLALAVHELTGDGFAVSAFFATTMVPVVVLAPLAGRIADRVEPVRVMALASLAQAAVAGALAFTSADLAAVLALSALLSAGSAISQPAEFALVPRLARDDDLPRANGLLESARYAGFAAGPLLAAAIAAAGGVQLAMLVNAATFLAIAAAAALIRTRRGTRHAHDDARGREGVALLWRDAVLRPTLLAAVGALLFISASITAEVFYLKDVLGASDAAYGVLMATWTAGMVAGAIGLAGRVPREALAVAALVALGVQGAGMASQTLWTVLPVAFAGYVVGGVAHGVKNTLLRTLIQRRVPERAHGSAYAAYNAARNSAEIVALSAGGALVAAVGPRTALLVAGLGPVVAALAGLAAVTRRRRGPVLTTPLPIGGGAT